MSNEEISKLMASQADISEESHEVDTDESEDDTSLPESSTDSIAGLLISQEEMDSLLSGFVSEGDGSHEDLIDEIYDAILDSGKLSLMQWVRLREKLRLIEELIPHIDLIIRLKSKNENKRTDI